MNALQVYQYNGVDIQFEVIDGQVMANATAMCKAFKKRPDDIFKTKAWSEFEQAVIEDLKLRYEDIRYAKQGGLEQGTWIHEELVLELARRLNPKFALWCNRKIAELLRTRETPKQELGTLDILELAIKGLREQQRGLDEVKQEVQQIKAQLTTSQPNCYTIMGYAVLQKVQISLTTAAQLGNKAKRICQQQGYAVETIPDPRFGKVGVYPESVLNQVFGK